MNKTPRDQPFAWPKHMCHSGWKGKHLFVFIPNSGLATAPLVELAPSLPKYVVPGMVVLVCCFIPPLNGNVKIIVPAAIDPGHARFLSPDCWSYRCMEGFMIQGWRLIVPGCGGSLATSLGEINNQSVGRMPSCILRIWRRKHSQQCRVKGCVAVCSDAAFAKSRSGYSTVGSGAV